MRNRAPAILAVAVAACLVPALGQAQLVEYSQDFESLIQTDTNALANDGWLVFGNVFAPDLTYLYGYGPFVAPNDGFAFCQIDLLQGGAEQGVQQLAVFSDYNNGDHALGNLVESNVYQEQTIDAADVGFIWSFEFQHKLGNLVAPSTALAFIKTLDPGNGFALTNFISADMTSIPATWSGSTLSITITQDLVGQLLQFGFSNTATNYESSGIFYDNVIFHVTGDVSSVPGVAAAEGVQLHQNYPNPFNPVTRIDFVLERPERVELAVYDLAGRRVATLHRGDLDAGRHHVEWDGRTAAGAPAATGHYRYVLTTATERVARGMILMK